jgi:hypothetical protein
MKNLIYLIIVRNVRPLSLIVFCSCIGYLLGGTITGLMIGFLIVATATLFFSKK